MISSKYLVLRIDLKGTRVHLIDVMVTMHFGYP